jgi:large subunit ribosomal protein L11
MAKKVVSAVKLQIPAGSATPAPPVGPALGQHGLNISGFCKDFNAATQDTEKGMVLSVVVTVYSDKSYSFVLKSPPASALLKKAVGVQKGSGEPQKDKIGRVTRAQLEEIATIKMPDLSANDMNAAVAIIAGTARSMGIDTELSEGGAS